MAPRKKPPARTPRPTPVLEWTAAGLGLLLTLCVLGYSVWEGVSGGNGPPSLTVTGGDPERTAGGFVVPLVVRNESYATAAAVEVRASLQQAGRVVEERRATFTYVPGRGKAKGGVVFQADPSSGRLVLEPEGYQDP
jgi:uncharacterized protein (TIGR02588 family)